MERWKERLVKAIGIEMPGLVEPATVARNAVSRVEAQAGKDMRGDLGTLLRRRRVDRVHAPEIRRQQSEEPQLSGDPPRPQRPARGRCPRGTGTDKRPHQQPQLRT